MKVDDNQVIQGITKNYIFSVEKEKEAILSFTFLSSPAFSKNVHLK